MSTTPSRPPRALLAPGLEISRMVTGLWQIADMERDGRTVDRERAVADLDAYAKAGFDTFDMADHYGSAELITGDFLRRRREAGGPTAIAFTKWCPQPGPMTADIVRAGIERSLDRLGVACIDLLQFHWWTFEHPTYLDALKEIASLQRQGRIRHIGVTNFDTAHLALVTRHGIPVVSNQVCFSVLDRRAGEDMSAFCLANGVRLLAYGTLGGGLISETWLGATGSDTMPDWSKSKYLRFVNAIGGWNVLQDILRALAVVAERHGVSIANVATHWVLDHPAVAGVIVGARLGESEHRADNLRCFAFDLDDSDRATLESAFARSTRIPGDCGDEYRRPPFLTASGDLSHHLAAIPKVYRPQPVPGRADRWRIDSGSIWEPLCGYSRAVRVGNRITVSGTTATHGSGELVCPGDPGGQTVHILDKIAASLASLGGSLEDVVRTRIFMRDCSQWEAVARVHGRYFGEIRPANTLVGISGLVGEGYEVEIEAEAIVDTPFDGG